MIYLKNWNKENCKSSVQNGKKELVHMVNFIVSEFWIQLASCSYWPWNRVVHLICELHLSCPFFIHWANFIFINGQLGLRNSFLQWDSLDPQEGTCSDRFWGHSMSGTAPLFSEMLIHEALALLRGWEAFYFSLWPKVEVEVLSLQTLKPISCSSPSGIYPVV